MTHADRDSLTGVWDGQFSYPQRGPPTGFTAVLFESGGTISGTTHETSELTGKMIHATLTGARSAGEVSFIKTYDPGLRPYYSVVSYVGRLNADATEIVGTWTLPGVWSGGFRMTRSQSQAEREAKLVRQEETVG